VPLVVLAGLATIGGFVETPRTLGGVTLFSRFLAGTFGAAGAHAAEAGGLGTEAALQLLAAIVSLGGVWLAYRLFLRRPPALERWRETRVADALRGFWLGGAGFDELYDRAIVRPFEWVARRLRGDFIDAFYTGLARTLAGLHAALAATQTGRVRLYAAGVAVGAILAIAIMVLR